MPVYSPLGGGSATVADGSITSAKIADDSIVNADINSAAAIAQSKLALTDSSDTAKGIVELATTAEATTGTDTARAVTPAGLKTARPAMSFVVIYSGGNWTYKGSTISARPSEMQTGDNIMFVGNVGGSLPGWAASEDIRTQA